MEPLLDLLLSLSIPVQILIHLFAAPFTKVEESFNLQAVHDILTYGIPDPFNPNATEIFVQKYDHFTFPGAVPRSFVGSLVLAELSIPIVKLVGDWVNTQVVIRALLGMFNAYALLSFRKTAKREFGRGVANWYLILQATQFHIIFYASRTLPNSFAFGLSTIALKNLLPNSTRRQQRLAYYLLTFSAVVFRSELALLLGSYISFLFVTGRSSFFRAILPGCLAGGVFGLLFTVGIDSFFWQSYTSITPFKTPIIGEYGITWPEFAAFHFNVLQGKSVEWGATPWHYYITSAIPKLLGNPLSIMILIPTALSVSPFSSIAVEMLVPIIGFVASFSQLAHKEWRFIMYIIPNLTLISAIGAHTIFARRGTHGLFAIATLLLIASVIATYISSAGMLFISSLNYPGGNAVDQLHSLLPHKTPVVVHLNVETCMTGASRFVQDAPIKPLIGRREQKGEFWVWSKQEDPKVLKDPMFWGGVDWAVSSAGQKPKLGSWSRVTGVLAFAGVKLYRPGDKVPSMKPLLGDQVGGVVDSVQDIVRGMSGGWTAGANFTEILTVYKKGTEEQVQTAIKKGPEEINW